MLASQIPTVYVETGWIVSLFYPHRTHHLAARTLRTSAQSGEVNLRVPYACILEAVHAIESAGQEAMQTITKSTRYLATAQRHGETSLDAVVPALQNAQAFLAQDPSPFLDSLRADPHVQLISATGDEIAQLDRVRSQVRFHGKDKFDLYVIATVLAHRKTAATEPAIFFSENKAEFEPKSASPIYTSAPRPASSKLPSLPLMPDALYKNAQIVWRADYDVKAARHEWAKSFASASPSP